MSEAETGVDTASQQRQSASGASITRLIKLTAIFGIVLILLLLIAALAAALTAAETWAPFVRVFRDLFLLLLLLESVLVIAALAILMLQAAGFLIMLRSEIKPILDNARETTRLSKATAQFVNANAIDPIIQIKSFLAGLLAFLRELIRLRAIVVNQESQDEDTHETETL